MDFTNEILLDYVGGQLVVCNEKQKYYYIGEIKEAIIEGEDDLILKVTFNWLAKSIDFPRPEKWIKDNKREYRVGLHSALFTPIPFNCINIQIINFGERVVFYPSDFHDKLDPSKVEGLNID